MAELGENPLMRDTYAANAEAYAREHFWTWESRMKREQEEVCALLKESEN